MCSFFSLGHTVYVFEVGYYGALFLIPGLLGLEDVVIEVN